jgi:hypothetical protein
LFQSGSAMCSAGRLTAAVESRQPEATSKLAATPPARLPTNLFTPRPLDELLSAGCAQ